MWDMGREMYSYSTTEICLGKVAVACHLCLILCGDFILRFKNSVFPVRHVVPSWAA